MDNRLQRGKPKSKTAREHIPADLYREMADKAASEALRGAESMIQAEMDVGGPNTKKSAQRRSQRLRSALGSGSEAELMRWWTRGPLRGSRRPSRMPSPPKGGRRLSGAPSTLCGSF